MWRGSVLLNPLSKETRVMRVLATVLVLAALAVTQVQAGVVTWQTPVTISGDTDVSTEGTLERAYNMGGAATTVNGVTFGHFAQNGDADGFASGTYQTWTVDNTTLGDGSKELYNPSSRGSTSAPFSGLSANYQSLLKDANYNTVDWSNISPLVLALNGLTIGQPYLFQSWFQDAAQADAYHIQNVTSGGATSATMQCNTSNADGGVGQYVIGTFMADATSQVVTFTGLAAPEHSTEIAGFQLRAIPSLPTPEPNTLFMAVSGLIGLLAYAWRKRK
jgi:hypothetical protein